MPASPVLVPVPVPVPVPAPVRSSGRTLLIVAVLAALIAAGCASHAPRAHWPKSAGAITPDDPADDGGESLEPHQVSEQAAAVEHGGSDLTSILDEPASVPPPGADAAPAPASTIPEAPAEQPEGAPVFEEVIIVN